jgi:hypothetical protein
MGAEKFSAYLFAMALDPSTTLCDDMGYNDLHHAEGWDR